MPVKDIATILQPVVENLYLLEDYITSEEEARTLELAKEIRTIYDLAVERLKCGRVG